MPDTDTPRWSRCTVTLPVAWLAGCLALVGIFGAAAAAGARQQPSTAGKPASPSQAAFFETKVRPVLAANCYGCHGAAAQLGGLRVDGLDHLLKGNEHGAAVLPGEPDKSSLVSVVRYDGKIKMPPAGKLRAEEIAALAAWVKMGAPWPPPGDAKTTGGSAAAAAAPKRWWSFRPVTRPAVLPPVANAAWAKTPIDRFVLAGLEAKGLLPAPPADRRTLLRRAYFDLVGLPPTPPQVAAFVADKRPDAFARVVDSLLASPHYGERWGRHWLDVARYADSNGQDENKAFAHAWRYRDWVIQSLNADLPYDEFVHQQIAGDLLPGPAAASDENARNARITATGFLCLGAKVLAEQDKPKLVMDIVDEQIEVTSKAVLGLTISCARCHDHKFDPISTKDYYALAGIFKSTKTMKDLGFVSNWNERPLPTKTLNAALAAHESKLQPLRTAVQKATEAANADLLASITRDAPKYRQAGEELARQPGALLSVAEAPAKPGDGLRQIIEAETFARGNALRNFDSYGKAIGVIHTGDAPTFAEWDVSVPAAGSYQIELRYAAQEARPARLLVNGQLVRGDAADAVTGSWNPQGQRWQAQAIHPLSAGKNVLRIERNGPIPHVDKLLVVSVPPAPALAAGARPRTVDEIAKEHGLIPELVTRWAEGKPAQSLPTKPAAFYSPSARAAIEAAAAALAAEQARAPVTPTVMAVEENTPENVRVHVRGSTQTLGDLAPRGFPVVLAGGNQPVIGTDRSGRLELARWLASAKNPLTARVAVNRVWQHHFGHGIVRTPDNFGLKGEKPTHPALLDYLADTFVREDGWSLKRLHRRILLSATYQMSARPAPATAARAARLDPENRLLWRANRRRLDAEPLRDALLQVSGKLDPALGGSLLTTPNNDYVTNDQSADAARYSSNRRSVYLPIVRNALFDEFQAFDFGDPATVNAQRASTTVAPQSLWLMNSPFAREQAGAFADALLQAKATDDASRLILAYRKAFGRAPTDAETRRAETFLARYCALLAPAEPDPAKRRRHAWQSFCQALFASNEFLYVD